MIHTDFQLTHNGYGVYEGTAPFLVKINYRVENRYVHRFNIWDRPIVTVSLFATPYRGMLWFFLKHARAGTFKKVPDNIFGKDIRAGLFFPEWEPNIWFTSNAYIIATGISYNKFNVTDDSMNKILEYGKENDLLTSPIMVRFNDLFSIWV